MTFQRFLVGILACALAAGVFAGPKSDQSTQSPVVRIGYLPIADSAQPVIAEDLKLFQKEGVKVELVPFAIGAKILEALTAGTIDVGLAGTVPLIQAASRGSHFVAIAGGAVQTAEQPYQGLAVAAASDVTSAADLKAKKVAVNALHGQGHFLAVLWLRSQGVDEKTVTFVEVPFERMAESLQQKEVAAASMIPTPTGSNIPAQGNALG